MHEVIITHITTEHQDCGCCEGGITYPVTKVYRFEFDESVFVEMAVEYLNNCATAKEVNFYCTECNHEWYTDLDGPMPPKCPQGCEGDNVENIGS